MSVIDVRDQDDSSGQTPSSRPTSIAPPQPVSPATVQSLAKPSAESSLLMKAMALSTKIWAWITLLIVMMIAIGCWILFLDGTPHKAASATVPQTAPTVTPSKKAVQCGTFAADDCSNVLLSALPEVVESGTSSSEKVGPTLDCSQGAKAIKDENGVLIAVNICDCTCKQ